MRCSEPGGGAAVAIVTLRTLGQIALIVSVVKTFNEIS